MSSGIALATFAVVATALVLISRMPLPRRLRDDPGDLAPDGPDDGPDRAEEPVDELVGSAAQAR